MKNRPEDEALDATFEAIGDFALVHLNKSLLASPDKTLRLEAGDFELFEKMIQAGTASISFGLEPTDDPERPTIVLRFASGDQTPSGRSH